MTFTRHIVPFPFPSCRCRPALPCYCALAANFIFLMGHDSFCVLLLCVISIQIQASLLVLIFMLMKNHSKIVPLYCESLEVKRNAGRAGGEPEPNAEKESEEDDNKFTAAKLFKRLFGFISRFNSFVRLSLDPAFVGGFACW